MSDKKTDGTKATGASDASRPATMSIAPAMDLSFEAVTVPPPPISGAASAPFSVPRAPGVPTESKPAAAPAKRKRSEDDIFSIFDVDSNTASDDIPISVQLVKKPEPVPEKPKSQLGRRTEEREVTRNRQIPIDQDLFNLSVGLFSSSQQASLGAPDMSAISGSGSSDKPVSTGGLFDDLVLPTAPTTPAAPLDSLDPLAPKPVTPKPAKYSSPTSHRTVLFTGITAAVLLTGGVFFYVQQSSPPTEPTAALQPLTTPTETALDTRPGQTTPAGQPQPRIATTDTPQNEPASLVKPAPTPESGTAPKEAQTGTSDKPGAQGKPSEAEATAKPAEPEPPPGPSKTQSLAEAMAAAAAPGGAGTPAPPSPTATATPPSSGTEFNKAAASAALNGAAGSASGCKAPGDPSGVARVSVTFAASGRATRAMVNGPPFAGTTTGSCVAAAFRSLSVPPFTGDAVTVSKSVTIH